MRQNVGPIQRIRIAWRAVRDQLRAAIADEAARSAYPGVRFGTGVLLRGTDRIVIGKGTFVDHRAYLNPSTVNSGRGYIRIGECAEIGPYSVLWGGGGILIGNNVHLGAHVHVTSQQGRRVPPEQIDPHVALVVDCAPVVIEDHVLIYSGTIVIPGVTIGHHAIVAAGSVVTEDVPPYSTAAGVPARVVRHGAIA
jgi:acetyltransferase-like isoleucine patch superfamily enzyme